MVPSRRRFLEAAGFAVAGSIGTAFVSASAESDPESEYEWPMARYDPAGTGYHPMASGPKDGVEVAWEHDATDWFRGTAPPIRRGETIYAAGNGLLALDSETGTRQFGSPGPYQSGLARARTSVYDTDTLAVTAPSGIFGVNSGGGIDLPVLNRSIGAERWAGPQSSGPGFFGPADPATPVAADGTIYTAVPGTNSIVALDPDDGRVRWRNTHHQDDKVSVSFNRPAVTDGLVFVTNWPWQVTAYDAETGAQRWQRELGEQTVLAPVATEMGVVVPTRNDVRLLDATSGERLWKRTHGGNITECVPAVADGTVYLPDQRESMHAFDLETGEELWTTPFDGPASPVVADGVVYAVRSGFSLVAIDAASGEQRFEYRPSQVPLSTPIVGDEVLYAANRNRVIALGEAT
ncbi:PQQ-binding-like beta-propeller repeat protein [Natrinema marinum]|uniref:PQQ-binding-like beta-propeller repeat protein n=1 Tax=Natrinema marinum TaxID=2961598 RepID=UPI0020C91AA2|nr:PQQ-binding-like beta-propeller repeat protein [Natrinema marinum]